MDMYNQSPIYPIKDRTGNGNHLYVMRDDLLPFGLGGNKVRIAEQFLQDMEKKGCDTMIAYGNVRSNLCRVIANACYGKKIPCYIICSTQKDESADIETSNSRIMKLLNAKMVYCKNNQVADTVEAVMNQIREDGHKPYYIYGNKLGTGNEGVAAGAYVKAYRQIKEFEKEASIRFDYIFHASGTGATQAGLTCGHILEGDQTQIVGILISSREYERAVSVIKNGMSSYLESIGEVWHSEYDQEIILAGEYTKGGYGAYDDEILQCIKEEFQEDSLPLDPVYTGKAFLGMQKYVMEQKIRDKNILFLHTGGTPLFYDSLNEGVILKNEV